MPRVTYKPPRKEVKKQKKIMVRFPKRSLKKVRTLINEQELKGIQALFDILVISGVVFRRGEIIDFIRENVPKYQERNKQVNLAKFGKVEKPPKIPMYGVTLAMYTADYVAFKNFVVEENIKQQWIFNILFEDGFANEEKCIMDLIERSKKLDISNRKKAIARLANDEYIIALAPEEANVILEQMTDEYDSKKFDDSLEEEIKSKIELQEILLRENIKDEDDEEDFEFSQKLKSIRKNREQQIKNLIKPKGE